MWSNHNLVSGDESESTTAGRSARIDRSVNVRDGEASGSKPKFDCIRRIDPDPDLTDRNRRLSVMMSDSPAAFRDAPPALKTPSRNEWWGPGFDSMPARMCNSSVTRLRREEDHAWNGGPVNMARTLSGVSCSSEPVTKITGERLMSRGNENVHGDVELVLTS